MTEDALALMAIAEERLDAVADLIAERIAELAGLQVKQRELISELHGATGDAVKAKRELITAQAKLGGSVNAHFTKLMDDQEKRLLKALQEADESLKDTFIRMLAAIMPDDLAQTLIQGAANTIGPMLTEVLEHQLPLIVKQEMGLMPKRGSGQKPSRQFLLEAGDVLGDNLLGHSDKPDDTSTPLPRGLATRLGRVNKNGTHGKRTGSSSGSDPE
jgi:hypothetical protein